MRMNASAPSTCHRMGFRRSSRLTLRQGASGLRCACFRALRAGAPTRAPATNTALIADPCAHCRTESCTGRRRARPSAFPAGLHCDWPKPGEQSAQPRAHHRIGRRTVAVVALPAPSGEASHPALAHTGLLAYCAGQAFLQEERGAQQEGCSREGKATRRTRIGPGVCCRLTLIQPQTVADLCATRWRRVAPWTHILAKAMPASDNQDFCELRVICFGCNGKTVDHTLL